ncbi:MAG: hypothetical protein GTO12_16145 [Proteobacteria bacterium]|nr:hypothetical protein [Pseudomonadota bacterium]
MMTHSLHRSGKAQETDFVWLLYHVKGINDENLLDRLRRAIELAEEAGTVNWGDVKTGPVVSVSSEEIKSRLTPASRIRGVFTSRQQVVHYLKSMKAADLGLCLVISGVLDQVFAACQDAGLKPHTNNYSLGIFGKRWLLAREDARAITTMCGHHMVPDEIVVHMQERVSSGKISPEKASLELAALCPCGIFNQKRAEWLLEENKEHAQLRKGAIKK